MVITAICLHLHWSQAWWTRKAGKQNRGHAVCCGAKRKRWQRWIARLAYTVLGCKTCLSFHPCSWCNGYRYFAGIRSTLLCQCPAVFMDSSVLSSLISWTWRWPANVWCSAWNCAAYGICRPVWYERRWAVHETLLSGSTACRKSDPYFLCRSWNRFFPY